MTKDFTFKFLKGFYLRVRVKVRVKVRGVLEFESGLKKVSIYGLIFKGFQFK